MTQAQEAARKGERPTLKERWQDFKEDMREKFVDRFAPIEDKITNESERLEMRNSLDRVLRADGIAEAFVRDNHLDEVIHSFANKREMQMFDQAFIAKHAIELEKNGVTTGRNIAKVLLEQARRDATIDWTERRMTQAKLRVSVKKTLARYGYPLDQQAIATDMVLEQARRYGNEWNQKRTVYEASGVSLLD